MKIRIKRLIAIYIDFIIICLCDTLIVEIITLGNANKNASLLVSIISTIIFLTLFYFGFTRKDLVFRNASIGKKIFKIAIFNNDGSIPDKEILIKRISYNLLLFNLDIIGIIISNKTSGDEKYHTQVANVKI